VGLRITLGFLTGIDKRKPDTSCTSSTVFPVISDGNFGPTVTKVLTVEVVL